MSLAPINTATPSNLHEQQKIQKATRHAHQRPSVENTKKRLSPTDVEKSEQLTSNQEEIQKLNAAAEQTNPLLSQFNKKIAATRL